jgi:hypothetical protein
MERQDGAEEGKERLHSMSLQSLHKPCPRTGRGKPPQVKLQWVLEAKSYPPKASKGLNHPVTALYLGVIRAPASPSPVQDHLAQSRADSTTWDSLVPQLLCLFCFTLGGIAMDR